MITSEEIYDQLTQEFGGVWIEGAYSFYLEFDKDTYVRYNVEHDSFATHIKGGQNMWATIHQVHKFIKKHTKLKNFQ